VKLARHIYDLLREPTGDVYRHLWKASADYCDVLLLVIRHTIKVNESAQAVIERLEPFLISQAESAEWPGTRLLDDTATVYRFELSSETISVLGEATDALFSWSQPEMPEDPCLIRFDGEPWLVTIAHEQDAYLNLTSEEKTSLEAGIPGLLMSRSEAA
jgi:hypothetical protein